ncbi:MAG: glycosyltransferase family 4 protein [Butyrivibrio sp.]
MSIKVCHFTSTHNPKDQRIFYKECVSLADNGYEVYLVEQGESEKDSGVNIVGTKERNKGRYYRLLVRPRKVYKLAKKIDADIYHFHDMELIPYALRLKKAGKKVIFDYHEDYASRFAYSDALPGPKWMKKFFAALYCKYEKRAIAKFDAMISVTPHICSRLAQINANTVMITNYPLIYDDAWGKEHKYLGNSDYIAFAGQVSETYRLAFITKAIQKIDGIRFKICGPQRKKDDLEKIINADENGKVDYQGVISYMEIPDFLGKSRCAIVISPYGPNTGGKIGTLGNNKLFEAMLCGVPVICSDFELWKEIIEEEKCGICVSPNRAEEVEDAVKYIVAHPNEAEQMGVNGRKAVLDKYNWKTQECKLMELYKALM